MRLGEGSCCRVTTITEELEQCQLLGLLFIDTLVVSDGLLMFKSFINQTNPCCSRHRFGSAHRHNGLEMKHLHKQTWTIMENNCGG